MTVPTLPTTQPLDGTEIKALFDTFTPDPSWSFERCTSRDTCRLTHGYHRYPAKFIPQLVDRLMDEYVRDVPCPTINDQFMGSGTTMACAIERGYRAAGTDINEVAYLIVRAKATPIDPSRIELRRIWLAERLERLDLGYSSNGLPQLIPECDRIDYWFPERQKIELGQILAAINEIDDEAERYFFLCGFSHILKNCSIWAMGSSKPSRDYKKEPRRPWRTYQVHLRKMDERNRRFWRMVPPAVRTDIRDYLQLRCGDARQQPCADNSVDLFVSSPPYVTSYEYADLHQLTALWFDYAKDLRTFRLKFIGTARPANDRPLAGASGIVQEMARQIEDDAVRAGVQRFFSDMRECFDETYRVLRPGARACYVIGNTRLKRVPILNAEAFVELLQEAGFLLERVILREIPLKTLPQTRDPETGRFANPEQDDHVAAYPSEYIIVARKPA